MKMNPNTSTNETKIADEAIEDVVYLLKYFKELDKTLKDETTEDPFSVSFYNSKRCVWLQSILLYMDKHQMIDKGLHEVLTNAIGFIEKDVDFYDSTLKEGSKDVKELSDILVRRQIHVHAVSLGYHVMTLISLVQSRLKELVTEKKTQQALLRQAEKLGETMAKQMKERKEKMSQYIR